MLMRSILLVLLILFGSSAQADTQSSLHEPGRGELLYTTHCIACHNSQVHWRDRRLVTDWASLRAEVRRWQKISGLVWNDEDNAAVARYLNEHYYLYPASY